MTNAVVKQECTQVCVGMSSPEKSSPEKPTMKERILETADRLFYLQGIRAVGVDTIAAEIGISQRTLLVDGSIAQDLVRNDPSMARAAKAAARVLLANAGVGVEPDAREKQRRATKKRAST